jgi:hypothetical protein
MMTISQKGGQFGVEISGVLVEAFLKYRSELRLKTAA